MSGNIFDLSGKSPKKKPQKTVTATPSPPASTSNDALGQIAKMKEMQANFTIQIEETLKKTGQDIQTISKYCQNPSNFSKEQWEELQKKKEDLEVMFSGLSKEAIEVKKKKKADVAASKERRGKTLGARKNWLDMR